MCKHNIYIYIYIYSFLNIVITTNGHHSDPGVMLISGVHSNEHHSEHHYRAGVMLISGVHSNEHHSEHH